DPQVERVARDALARLREQGAELVDVDVGAWLADADDIFWTLINTGMRGDLAGYFERQGIALQAEAVIDAIASKDTWRLFALAREAPLTAAAIEAARGEGRARTAARYREMFEAQGLTAIAYPTEPLVAPPI